MHMLYEKSLDHNICFVDYNKAFDRVDCVELTEIIRDTGVD